MPSVPNTPGPIKFAMLGGGIAAGLGASVAIDRALTGPDKAKELREQGIETLDSRQGSVYALALPFSVAAGIGLGIQRRSPTAGLTTTSQIAAAALLSTVAGAVINAESDKAGDYVTGIGVMSAAVGAGVLFGVRDEVRLTTARMAGLALFGAAIGVAAPMVMRSVASIPGELRNSVEHRER